ncbi:origin recognition complex subunit 3 N-terminus-domain-containing protein [Podospora appendiculata]|uniref:Origin recognition complex subunit 3 N-terminus-domain-containing protein n=1 Tax=Podospora appendiculata TaxID=314037 RepID=A0AAE1CH05_9PEZI|nr:origin recognition complex subunit 3 N-terminus-domain-containing protein [Podospora appendiculata]
MAEVDDTNTLLFQEDDHRTAYIFTPTYGVEQTAAQNQNARPAKRRRTSKKGANASAPELEPEPQSELGAPRSAGEADFPPLFNGAESLHAAGLRRTTFETAWPVLNGRIQNVLRRANRETLDEVALFMREAGAEAETAGGKIPAGFIITGPNIASQDLLFEQLAEGLSEATGAKVVRLRSAGAPNLKAVLKKIIRDATSRGADGGDDAEVSVGSDGRKYLNYDLEALHVFLTAQDSRRVIVAFEDSEAFDSGLLADLIALFHSWHDRIHFSVLFGVATSVDLFQQRLLKATAQQLYGAQFDVVQADSVLESVFMGAVAGSRAALRLGPSLLQSLLERQKDQVAGVHNFISSLKYAYMCHFYANPLSVLLAEEGVLAIEPLQPEHLEAVRTLDSFKQHVEAAVDARQLAHAQSLLENDEYLVAQVLEQTQKRKDYLSQLLRSLHLISATGLHPGRFTDLYVSALADGIDLSSDVPPMLDSIRRLNPSQIIDLVHRLLTAISKGNPDLDLEGWEDQEESEELRSCLTDLSDEVQALLDQSKLSGKSLKSKYSSQSKILRTTVVAQKVQLSHDTATLTEADKAFSKAVDNLTELLSRFIHCEPVGGLLLHEAWVYDSKSPYRDVFVPRPATTFARALSRPHDYLGCACCSKPDGGLVPTFPTTSILYHLYLEAGALLNVADLWSAYYTLVGEESELALDERTALVRFYQGLAELKLMGFVKPSKKKADHVAKLKWL